MGICRATLRAHVTCDNNFFSSAEDDVFSVTVNARIELQIYSQQINQNNKTFYGNSDDTTIKFYMSI